jgi:glycosyltransferase involved in cell wall biosynthesis
MHDPETTSFDVSVVLNLYKQPESLEIQLQAIENQTLKPKEILLYQDGTGDTIKIPENIKHRFNLIEINPKNAGVWARFDFAMRKASCKYVCVFDDDTVPGSRWLENCHTEMMKQDGLYGTIGIILEKPELYPHIYKGSHFRAGWHGNLKYTVEVDFVGHSWFFKREWLAFLFNAPMELKNYKFVGEDMSFSYQLFTEAGIKTYVPPHPKNKYELHGSLKKHAVNFGNSKKAVSLNPANIGMMTGAINILLKNGWKTLILRDKKYVKKIKKQLKWQNSLLINFVTRCMMFAKKKLLKRI